jgi:hypothetical protein
MKLTPFEEKSLTKCGWSRSPKPRWTAYDAKRFNLDLPDDVVMTVQDRAFTSPIWYTP